MKFKTSFLAFAFLATGAAVAQPAAERIEVRQPWVRAMPPGSTVTGAFMLLRNTGGKEVQLVKAESPAAAKVELHEHAAENGVMKMRPVARIAIKPNGETALKSGSYHIMLIDLKAPLKEGDVVPIALGFDDGSRRSIDAKVSRSPAHEGHAH